MPYADGDERGWNGMDRSTRERVKMEGGGGGGGGGK